MHRPREEDRAILMTRRLGLFALLLPAFAPASAMAADTTAPTGSVTAAPALVVKTPNMSMTIKVAGDDHGGEGIASIHLFVVAAGKETAIRTFDPGKDAPQKYDASMSWDAGLRELKPGKYTLRAKVFDAAENVSTASFPFEIRTAANAPKQKVKLDVVPKVGSGLTLKITAKGSGEVLGKLRVVVHKRNKKGAFKVFKKFSKNASDPWTLKVPLSKGAYRWQVFYDAKAPYVSTQTSAHSFGI
jgi:hypothetical protein